MDLGPVLKELLPQMNLTTQFALNGVNCHNTSLLAAGVLENPSYVSGEELAHILRTRCHEIAQPVGGAIGVIREGGPASHSFYVVIPNLVLEKRNLKANSGYQLHAVKAAPPAKYYVCQRAEAICENPEVINLRTRVRAEDKYYYGLVQSYAGFSERSAHRATVRKLVEDSTKLKILDEPCKNEVSDLHFRLVSLRALGDQLEGMGALYQQRDFNLKN